MREGRSRGLAQRTNSSREVLLQLQNSVNNEKLFFGTGTKLTVIGKTKIRSLYYACNTVLGDKNIFNSQQNNDHVSVIYDDRINDLLVVY